ncbi:uncharacterized protein LOC144732167 isoform X1 [Lampetra planeri]
MRASLLVALLAALGAVVVAAFSPGYYARCECVNDLFTGKVKPRSVRRARLVERSFSCSHEENRHTMGEGSRRSVPRHERVLGGQRCGLHAGKRLCRPRGVRAEGAATTPPQEGPCADERAGETAREEARGRESAPETTKERRPLNRMWVTDFQRRHGTSHPMLFSLALTASALAWPPKR